MAFLACGWGLGRGLLSLAAVGFAFYLQRKVQYLEKRVRKLEDEKELKDVDAEARGLEMQKSEYAVLHPEVSEDVLQKQLKNQQVEAIDKERSRDVEGLQGRVQELEDGNKNFNELYSAASQRGDCIDKCEKRKLSREVEGLQQLVRELEDNTTMLKALHNAASHGRACMEKKLLLAEKKVEDYAALNKEASENLKNLESEKQELQSSLNYALEKVKKKQHVFEDYRMEVDIFMDAALEKVRVKERECEDLAFQNERHLQEKEELQREIERLCNQEEATYAKSIALADASPMEQSSLPKYCLQPKLSPTSSACSKSIGRDPRLASPYIKWYNNPLYETKPARFTTAALSCQEEVIAGSEFMGEDPSSASPVIKWNDNPLYET